MRVRWSTDTSTSGGSSETEVNAFAVIAWISPPCAVVTTVTPVVKRPSVRRIAPGSIRWAVRLMAVASGPSAAVARAVALAAEEADVGVVDHVGHRPAVEVVLRHALLGEALERVGLAVGHRVEQDLEADVLVVARVVALVELVAAAELRAEGVPRELHELHALDGVVAVRAAHVLVEKRAQLRGLEVDRMRVEVDQRAAEVVLDDLLDPRVC